MPDRTRNSVVQYAFDARPEAGDTMQVAPGVYWLRMPLPFVLGHINLWLLEDGDGWTIVDTGVYVEESEKIWNAIFASTMNGQSVGRVIVTHLHPDHAGCAGWLCSGTGAELWMTREEYFLCRILVADTGRDAPDAGKQFYRAAGFGEDALERYTRMFGLFGKFVSPLPQSYHRLRDEDEITIGERSWTILIGRGHSPEHACLFCEELNLLIAGDQLLPTISSNVSVHPTEPLANPLAEWLASLRHLQNRLPEDVLVLPAHGKPFRNAHARLEELIAEHDVGLQKLEALCASPKRATDVFPALFRREIDDRNLIMATGEAIAHLNYLVTMGRMSVDPDDDGVNWFSAAR